MYIAPVPSQNYNNSFKGFIPKKAVQEKAFYITAAFLGLDCAKNWFPSVQKDVFEKQNEVKFSYPREIPRALKHAEAMNEKELFDAKKAVVDKIVTHDIWGNDESIAITLEGWLINEESLDGTKATSELIELILSKECLFNNKNIKERINDIAFDCCTKDSATERRIKKEVLQKYSDSVGVKCNSNIPFCIGSIVANTDYNIEKDVVDLVFDNKALYTNPNVVDALQMGHFRIPVTDYNSSHEAFCAKKDIADLYIRDGNLQNEKEIVSSIGNILTHVDETNDRLTAKILKNKSLYQDEEILSNITKILDCAKNTSWFEVDNFLDRVLEEPKILKAYPVAEILQVLENSYQSNLLDKIISNPKYEHKAFLKTELPNVLAAVQSLEDAKLVEMVIEQEDFVNDTKVMFSLANLVTDAQNDENIAYLVNKVIENNDTKGLVSIINLLKRLTY